MAKIYRKNRYKLNRFDVYRVYTITNRIMHGYDVTDCAFDNMIKTLDLKAPDIKLSDLIEMALYYDLDLMLPNVR